MTKIKINKYISYFLGLILLSFGIVLAVKADLGITVSTSPSYVLSIWSDIVSFGTFNYIVQGIVFILMVVVLKKIKTVYFLSFLTSVILGYTIDFFAKVMASVQADTYGMKGFLFVSSIIVISVGLVFFIKSNKPILPFDMFVREISAKYDIGIGKFKTGFDISVLVISIAMSYLFFGELRGIHIGTLISALTIGSCVGFFMKLFDGIFYVEESSMEIS